MLKKMLFNIRKRFLVSSKKEEITDIFLDINSINLRFDANEDEIKQVKQRLTSYLNNDDIILSPKTKDEIRLILNTINDIFLKQDTMLSSNPITVPVSLGIEKSIIDDNTVENQVSGIKNPDTLSQNCKENTVISPRVEINKKIKFLNLEFNEINYIYNKEKENNVYTLIKKNNIAIFYLTEIT